MRETIESVYDPHEEREFDEWDLDGYGAVLRCVAANRSIELDGISAETGISSDRVEGIAGVMETLGLVEWSFGEEESTVESTPTTWSILLRSGYHSDVERVVGEKARLSPEEQPEFVEMLAYLAGRATAVGVVELSNELDVEHERVRELLRTAEELAWVQPDSDGAVVTERFEEALADIRSEGPSESGDSSELDISSDRVGRLLRSELEGAGEDLDLYEDTVTTIAKHGPIGLVRLSNSIGCSHERTRELLRALNERGWVRQTSDGPLLTDRFEEALSGSDAAEPDGQPTRSEDSTADVSNATADTASTPGKRDRDRGQIDTQQSGTDATDDTEPPVSYGDTSATAVGELEYFDLEIDRRLGEGSFGEVSVASTSDNQRVAVKTPKSDGTIHVDAIERFMSEAETWNKLDDHEHVVDVYGYDSSPIPHIAMEYMDGGSLSERADGLSLEQAVTIATSLTDAILHAHRRGVIHLDLKPENVLFRTATDGLDVPKLSDWGLAKRTLDPRDGRSGLSPPYAAPEQLDDSIGELDQRTDVYQLGALLYTLTTGAQPYTGPTATVPQSVVRDDPPVPSHERAVPSALDEIVTTAMATDPADRFEDVIYLRDRLTGLSV
ncbi:protein kinase [Halobaculum sp. WSA2]|uniref:Protein kinase n=1 Tax=Halobaculum saliterrae TaxID=2073113 RepID=A0A6B0SQH6_9EURY|nr:protein kinase [Halobaculum saliterrae]MXR40737.1 protein kinase [Halobaculum saliterrae]